MRFSAIAVAILLVVTAVLISCSSDNPTEPKQTAAVPDSTAVYVSAAADGGTADGSMSHPFPQIQTGIDEAVRLGRRNVLVSFGTYTGSLTMRDKVSVHGGYHPTTWTRPASAILSVVQGGTTAVTIPDADSLTVEYLSIRSADATVPGSSSIGILIRGGSTGVVIANNRIEAGSGADGIDRGIAVDPRDAQSHYAGYGEDADYCPPAPAGGAGGYFTIGPSNFGRGGAGGNGGFKGGDGSPGSGPLGGDGGLGTVGGGFDGLPGQGGPRGAAGSAGINLGPLGPEGYRAADGSSGQRGSAGGGGGGGAGGSGYLACGGGGGGGGQGGVGGAPGLGGGGGGGSFGVLLTQGTVVIRDNTIVTASGGAGGDGGTGLLGGLGASGVRGGYVNNNILQVDFQCTQGATGGNGGRGGSGGSGGGGGGGPSVGIAYLQSPTTSGNVFTIGPAGAGGTSAPTGNPGASGQSFETKLFLAVP